MIFTSSYMKEIEFRLLSNLDEKYFFKNIWKSFSN
jgi:hypothetical protein